MGATSQKIVFILAATETRNLTESNGVQVKTKIFPVFICNMENSTQVISTMNHYDSGSLLISK